MTRRQKIEEISKMLEETRQNHLMAELILASATQTIKVIDGVFAMMDDLEPKRLEAAEKKQ